ncbi:DUF305 domain-containing protein [Nocardioides daeguensis]|uniref:DUF305 domain-containing protein n=1 Tax=Nocardioides daeguensis TaxID=908359 RepID=A0ABP6WC70_9ACTN|nr:DUF305 domain-containing protein [Nocardioides daeguensis]MBV6728034.1 DUF305 domain-containing protein [Nocardioides daeguensis]MCR1774108.1 DUF305 domain-containing protein [Nocardioides daeguensis]
MHRTTLRRLACATGAITLALALAACGDGDDGREGRPAAVETARNGNVFNSADVAFATAMIPHHAQALQMALLAQDRPLSPEVRALVDQIQAAQTPEVETMTTWLTDWDKKVPATSLDHANAGHDLDDMEGMGGADDSDVPGHDMPGMMSGDQLDELEESSDADFPRLWMEMMIEHHEGAITMARTEQADGRFADAIALAKAIVEGQSAEITTMEKLLDQQ